MTATKRSTLLVLCTALHVSCLLYVGFVVIFAQGPSWETGWRILPERTLIFYALIGVSMMQVVLTIMAPRLVKPSTASAPPPNPLTYQPSVDAMANPTTATDSCWCDFSNITPRVMTITILRMAIAEAIVLNGLLLAMLNHSALVIAPFAAVGLFMQLLFSPIGKRSEVAR